MNYHTERYPFCRVTYWKNHTAASPDGEWDTCAVTPLGGYSYGEQSFSNTSQDIHRRDALIRFLEKAYELGRSAAKQEIREALGVKDPRS